MQELSLNILDIAENSVKAGASLITVAVCYRPAADRLTVTITDDGCGMDAETVRKVTDPFYTTRTTRKVGLGIPLMMSIYEATGVFQNVFVFGFIVDIVIIALVILAKKSSRTLRWLSE